MIFTLLTDITYSILGRSVYRFMTYQKIASTVVQYPEEELKTEGKGKHY
jgi:hypothetical protein